MGTVQAISRIKAMSRRMAATLYAHAPGFLKCLTGKVVILTYHRVVTDRELAEHAIQPGMYVSRDVFAAHMRFLNTHFTVLSFGELLTLWDDGRWDAGARYCVVTFDDGWLDNYLYALPILSAYRIPATVFLPTGFIGTAEWFWPEKISWLAGQNMRRALPERMGLHRELTRRTGWPAAERVVKGQEDIDALIEACKAESLDRINLFASSWADLLEVALPSDRQVVTWDEVREMSAAGVTFGSHSVSHRILPALSHEEIVREAAESWTALSRQSIRTVPVFCYPNGNWSDEVGQCVEAAGYRAATTTQFGYESATPVHRFGLKRINVHHDVTCSDDLFAFHLAGFNHRGRG